MGNPVDIFLKLVKTDSPSGEEGLMAKYLKAWLDKYEWKYKVDQVGNIFAKNKTQGKPVLFTAHMDTVEPGKGIKPVVKSGWIKSSGNTILGADNKAWLAALLSALESIPADKQPALELLFTVKEETGGGVENFPKHWLQANTAYLFDSAKPLGGIIMRSPHITNFKAVLSGKASHASEPHKGINAFTPAFKALAKIETGILDGGETTTNIGLINGGKGINTVPDDLQIAGEVRSYSKKHFYNRLKKIEKILTAEAAKHKAKLSIKTDGYCPGYVHDKNDGIILSLAAIIKKNGLPVKHYMHSGISDANILNSWGLKTINLADGTVDPHTVNERIKTKDLEKLSYLARAMVLNS